MAAAAAVAAVILIIGRSARTPTSAPALANNSAERADPTIHFRDGSMAVPRDANTRLLVVEESKTRIVLELLEGAARFQVAPDRTRLFQVRSGAVTASAVGTEFAAERAGEKLLVFAQSGAVRVEWPGGERLLAAPEQGAFPPALAAPAEGSPDAGSALPRAPLHAKSARPVPTAPAWKQLAEAGQYPEAFQALDALPVSGVRDDVDELLLAADTARLSGHPAAALPFLERVEHDHAGDARAPLAAFTLGRLYLNDLGKYALLTKSDEVLLAQTVEAGRTARAELAEGPDLTPSRQRELAR